MQGGCGRSAFGWAVGVGVVPGGSTCGVRGLFLRGSICVMRSLLVGFSGCPGLGWGFGWLRVGWLRVGWLVSWKGTDWWSRVSAATTFVVCRDIQMFRGYWKNARIREGA